MSGGWLRASVFGAMDGLVTNIALVVGVGAAGAHPRVVVLTGMAGLVAGAFSMALGEYTSVLAAGAIASLFTVRPWWHSALRQLFFGAIAAEATYVVGTLIGVGVPG